MTGCTAVLDANVLYPAPLRDLFLQLAFDGLFQPRWSVEIQNEWVRNVLLNRPDIAPEKLDRTTSLMNRAFPTANVSGYESIIPTATNHPKDAHVLALAINVEADCIVTFNLKDFVSDTTEVVYIKAVHPDDFAMQLMIENRMDFLSSIGHVLGRLARPTPTLHEYLGLLTKCGLPKTANAAYTALTNH
ncbi:MAG: PIN domain-containing protein [Armatimonadaceae bacterium]